jgi:hypothetical protein
MKEEFNPFDHPSYVKRDAEDDRSARNGNGLCGYFPLIGEFDPNAKPKPTVRMPGEGYTISEFGKALGGILKDQNFFKWDKRCARIELNNRLEVFELVEIDPQQFRSLIENFCWVCVIKMFEKDGAQQSFQAKKSIPIDIARATLANDDFLDSLRPISALNTVRLPVLRKSGKIELLPDGYDEESQIFTISKDNEFAEDWSLENSCEYLRNLVSEFCFRPDDRERATAVLLAGMLTLFGTHVFGSRIVKPAFVITANSEGSGKTLAAKLAIIPRLGYCPTGTVPTDEAETRKLVTATVIDGSPVLFLDNVSGYLKSSALEALITDPTHKDRVLGESKTREIPHVLTVIITGNSLSLSPDLNRRSLIIELFLEEARPEDRVINNPLDNEKILARRSQILSALWALMRGWNEAGKPPGKVTHASFLAYSEIIGGILEHADFGSPFLNPTLRDSGNRDQQDMEKMVENMLPGFRLPFSELADLADEYGLFENLIPREENDPHATSKRKKLSDLFRKYSGRVFRGGQKFLIVGENSKNRRYLIDQIR